MRIATKLVFDLQSGTLLESDYEDYSGPVALCKGATSTANAQRTQQLGMQTTAFNTQQNQIAALQKAFSPYLSGTQGFSPQAMTGMQSQFLNNNNSTFNQAGQQVRSALAARGEGTGGNPVGGNYAAGLSNLLGAKAGSQSQGLLGLQLQNAQQGLTNMFNAGNLLSGNAATLTGTQGVAGSGASNALNSYINASNSGFLGSFQNAFGGALGKGLGAGLSTFATGGMGTLGSLMGSGSGLTNVGAPGATVPLYGG